MNRTQMIKRAYVRGLAARGIYRARLRQKQAAGGLKDYAISGGIGAAGGGALGSLIGALVQYARKKNVLRGALVGGGIGGGLGLLGGLGKAYLNANHPAFMPVDSAAKAGLRYRVNLNDVPQETVEPEDLTEALNTANYLLDAESNVGSSTQTPQERYLALSQPARQAKNNAITNRWIEQLTGLPITSSTGKPATSVDSSAQALNERSRETARELEAWQADRDSWNDVDNPAAQAFQETNVKEPSKKPQKRYRVPSQEDVQNTTRALINTGLSWLKKHKKENTQ